MAKKFHRIKQLLMNLKL